MTQIRTTNVNSVEYRTLTNQLVFSRGQGQSSKEKGEMHDILRRRREKYRQTGKYNNMILKAHNRERNKFDKNRVPFHLRNYTHFDNDANETI